MLVTSIKNRESNSLSLNYFKVKFLSQKGLGTVKTDNERVYFETKLSKAYGYRLSQCIEFNQPLYFHLLKH